MKQSSRVIRSISPVLRFFLKISARVTIWQAERNASRDLARVMNARLPRQQRRAAERKITKTTARVLARAAR